MIAHVVRRELAARWILAPIAVVVGALAMIAIQSIGHVRGDADNIMNGTWVGTLVVSTIVGMSLLSDELTNSRLSFYFARPFSPRTIFLGKLTAGVLLALVMQLAIVFLVALALPALSWRGSAFAERHILSVGAERVLATVACTLLGMAASIALGSKSRWFVLDALGLAIAGVVGTWFALRLEPDPGWLPADSIRSAGEKALLHGAAFAVVAIGLSVATARALVIGRTDRMRAHRMLSTTLWPLVVPALLLLACIGELTMPQIPDPPVIAGLTAPAIRNDTVSVTNDSPVPYIVLVDDTGHYRVGAVSSWEQLDAGRARLSSPIPVGWNPPSYVGPYNFVERFLRARRDDETSGPLAVASIALLEDEFQRGIELERETREQILRLPVQGSEYPRIFSFDLIEQATRRKRDLVERALRTQETTLARAANLLGLMVDRHGPGYPQRQARTYGWIRHTSKQPWYRALMLADPTMKALTVIDFVASMQVSIGVSRQGRIRPLRRVFRLDGYSVGYGPWVEVRVSRDRMVVESVPGPSQEIVRIDQIAPAIASVWARHRSETLWNVDVLVADDVDAQRLVDVLVAVEDAKVEVIGIGKMPDASQLAIRGHHVPSIWITLHHDSRSEGRDYRSDEAVVRGAGSRIARCFDSPHHYAEGLGAVTATLVIGVDAKVSCSAIGLVPGRARCIARVLDTLKFAKRDEWNRGRVLPRSTRYSVEITRDK